MIPTYSDRDIEEVKECIIDTIEQIDESEVKRELKKIDKIRSAEQLVKYFISESWDLYTFDDFVRGCKNVSQGLKIELLGWAHFWEDKWDT